MSGNSSRSTKRTRSGDNVIDLYVIGFGRPDLLMEQKRLLDKYLTDEFTLTLVDNTPAPNDTAMENLCERLEITYIKSVSKERLHPEALNQAALHVTQRNSEFFGFLDHDVFPRRSTHLIEKLKKSGFYGIGQKHAPTGHSYLWPGFCFFSREWLTGRKLDFDGIRGVYKRDDGDCGSMNWPLFENADWEAMFKSEHGYQAVREPDEYGLQSWGYEIMGDFIHLTNASHWMDVPEPHERDRALREIVAAL